MIGSRKSILAGDAASLLHDLAAMGSPQSAKPSGTPSSSSARPGDRVVDAKFLAGATATDHFPPPAIVEIAFAGRSNVGKSSLMNSLTGRNGLVRTSSTPGCTRQVSWFRTVSDDGAQIDLVDLPGYGYAKRSKVERNAWARLIEGYLLGRPTLRGVIVLVDIRRGIEQDDLDLVELLQTPAEVSRPALEVRLVATKLDKLSRAAQKPALEKLRAAAGRPITGYSAPENTGRVSLWRNIRRIAGVEAPSGDSGPRQVPGTAPAHETVKTSEGEG